MHPFYTLLKPKRHSLRCHGFMGHALLLHMHTNVVYFRVMRRLCRRKWNWLCLHLCLNLHPWQQTRDHGVWHLTLTAYCPPETRFWSQFRGRSQRCLFCFFVLIHRAIHTTLWTSQTSADHEQGAWSVICARSLVKWWTHFIVPLLGNVQYDTAYFISF